MSVEDRRRFAGLSFEDFRRMAGDPSLSPTERIGFPDAFRDGTDALILDDVRFKLPALERTGAVVMDIGCGCGRLSHLVRELCAERRHELVLVDSAEMLAHHPDGPGVEKVAARFPACPALLDARRGAVDAILVYSVVQYAFADASVFAFLDAAVELLAPGGRLLVADIPNASMRTRFLVSEAGAAHHRAYTGRDERPQPRLGVVPHGEPDDAVVLGLAARARSAGLHAWIVPQPPALPMANRREDLLIERP